MFQPPDFQTPATQIPPHYTTQEEYCAIAVPFIENADDTFNYSFQDMLQNDEVYRTYFEINLPFYQYGVGLQSLDSFCRLTYNENTLIIRFNTNYAITAPNPNACDLIDTNYPIFANKIENFRTPNFEDRAMGENISGFGNEIRQIRDQNLKIITSNILFTDQQICSIDLTRRENEGNIETQTQNCVCPGLEVIEPSKNSNSQIAVTDAPVSDSSVTVPVTDVQMTASVTDAPARQP